MGKIYYYEGTITHPEPERLQFLDYFTDEKDLNEKLQAFYKKQKWEVMYDRWIHTAENVRDIDFGSYTKFIRVVYEDER